MKYKKIFSFLLVVCLVASLWFISKYKDVFKEEVMFKVTLINVPENIFIDVNALELTIPVEIQANGFTLIYEKIFGHDVALDFKENTYTRNDSTFFNPSRSFKTIKRSKSDTYQVISVDNNELFVPLTKFISKKVPLKGNVNITYAKNFVAVKNPYFVPDSVLITGNDKKVSAINSLMINDLDITNVNDTVTISSINLKERFPEIKFSDPSVDFVIEAAQMTEGTFSVKVDLINVPERNTVKVFPDQVKVVYTTRIKDFEQVKLSDIKAIINYNDLDDVNASVSPLILIQNKKIISSRIDPKQVQVLTIN